MRREGVSVESVLDVMKEQGARAKLVVVDASRRNPYERRFRSFSPWARADHRARQRADPVLGDAGQGRRRFQRPAQRAGRRAAQSSRARSRSAPKPSSTRPASRSPAPPTASRCPRCRPRCSKTSASARSPRTPEADATISQPGKSARAASASSCGSLSMGEVRLTAFRSASLELSRTILPTAALLPVRRRRRTGRTGSPSRSSAPARATTSSPSLRPSRISICPPDISPTSTRSRLDALRVSPPAPRCRRCRRGPR